MLRHMESLAGPDVLPDWVALATPRYQPPNHLLPLAEAFWRADKGQEVLMCSSTPPRHGKTESILHWMVRHLCHHPDETVAYISFAAERAQQKSRVALDIARAMGLEIKRGAANHWTTKQGGGFIAQGVNGPLTGTGLHMLVVDDPIKNRKEAESETYRDSIHEWFTSTAMSRFEPGCPVRAIVNMARWHDDDLIGRLLKQTDVAWSYMNLPAISDEGPLWPLYTLEALDLKRRIVGEYDWASLYMGQPMPREGYVFHEPTRYRVPDVVGARIAIGVDPAATSKTSSDYSAIVVLAAKGQGSDQMVSVLDVWRGQVEVPELVKRCASVTKHWGAPCFVEAVGGFKAVPQMMRAIDPKLRVVDLQPTTDKFTRSLPAKAAWNDGRIRVPMPGTTKWVDDFVGEVCKFTGHDDAHDDQVDALAHAFSAIDQRTASMQRGVLSLKGGMG